ncbi:MAG: alpha/beta hydrolase [Acidilobaceae archaeon]
MISEDITHSGVRCKVYVSSVRPLVVLLHGYSFKASVWGEISLFDELESRGWGFLSLSMPYGKVSECSIKSRDEDLNLGFLRAAIERFKVERPVLLGSSLGGYFALMYALRYPVRALVLVAPVGIRRFSSESLSKLNVRALILWGSRDEIASFESMKLISDSLRGQLNIYDGLGHALYLDDPNTFKRDVTMFLEGLFSS